MDHTFSSYDNKPLITNSSILLLLEKFCSDPLHVVEGQQGRHPKGLDEQPRSRTGRF